MGFYDALIRYLYSGLPEIPKKTTRSEMLQAYYDNKYPKSDIYYRGRVLPDSKTRFRVSPLNFFTLNDPKLHNIVKVAQKASMTDNQRALYCLKWVIEHIPYKSDISNYNLKEFWCMPYETLKKGSGDCDDLSILLANLMLVSGIPNWKIRIVAGYVMEPVSKRQLGHLFVTFFDEKKEKWVLLDACYYPNLKKISDREEYKKDKRYQDVWFSFNSTACYAKESGDVRKMQGFEEDVGRN